MTNDAFVQLYRDTRQELIVLERQLDRSGATGRPRGVRVVTWDASPGTNDTVSAALQLEDGLADQVAKKRAELQAMQPRFDALVLSAGHFRERCILRQYYGLAQTDEQIADCLSLSPRHVRRLRRSLLDRLAEAS